MIGRVMILGDDVMRYAWMLMYCTGDVIRYVQMFNMYFVWYIWRQFGRTIKWREHFQFNSSQLSQTYSMSLSNACPNPEQKLLLAGAF